ncbi:5285_t:CDS:2, partial [Entrophospora sp. SA101]
MDNKQEEFIEEIDFSTLFKKDRQVNPDSEKPPNLKNLEKLFNKNENSNIVFALVEGGNISFVEV